MFAIRLSSTALARTPLQSLRALSTTAVVPKLQVALSYQTELLSGGLHAPSLILPRQKLILPEPEPFELLPEGAREGQAIIAERVSELLVTRRRLMKIGTCFEDNLKKRMKSQDYNSDFFDEFVVIIDGISCDSLGAHLEGYGIDLCLLNGFGVNKKKERGFRDGRNSFSRRKGEDGYSSNRPGLIYAAITTHPPCELEQFHRNYESPYQKKMRLQHEQRLQKLRQQQAFNRIII